PAILKTETWVPGRARSQRAPPGLGSLLGLGLLRLLRLLGLLRFLSHSILSRFNGLNATPRHACGGGPTSQHPHVYFQQIRRLLPRAVTSLSWRYPQLLCV